MKQQIRLFLCMLLIILAAALRQEPVSAASSSMQITAINLPPEAGSKEDADGGDAGGEAVLIQSQGSFLLMDCGKEEVSNTLIKNLKQAGVTELDVYISHTHNDHRGGLQAVCDNFKVNTIYLPDTSIGTEYKESNTGTTQAAIYKIINRIAEQEHAQVVYLKKDSTFRFGSVSAQVLGPVGNYKMSQFKAEAGDSGSQSGHYLNNCSLTAMLTCGTTKFLTCGDIEKEEEAALVRTYGSRLKADILKLSHHGLPTSNTESFLKAVSPDFSFAENASYVGSTKTEDGKVVKKTYTAQNRAMDYGFCYMVGDEAKNLIIQAADNHISLYRGLANAASQMTGWVKVQGVAQTKSGAYTGENEFYIDSATGKTRKGVQKIGTKHYYLGTGGCLEKGYYEKGKYVPYRSYGKKIRHFAADGEMTTGFKTIDGNKFFFDPEGYKIFGDKKWGIYLLNGKYYAVNQNGAVFTNKNKGGWKKYSSTKLRYFKPSGEMVTGWKKLKGKYYYLDPSTGYRTLGARKIDKYIYFFHEEYGFRLDSQWAQSKSGDRYLLDKKGRARTGLVKYENQYYGFDENTAVLLKGLSQINNKVYYFEPTTGAGVRKATIKLSGKKYKTNNKAQVSNPPSFMKKKVSKVKLKAGKQKLKVSFKKMSGINGYEIYLSDSRDGLYEKAATLKKASKTDTTIKKLTSHKTYYLKIRAYKKWNKITTYTRYSDIKSIVVR